MAIAGMGDAGRPIAKALAVIAHEKELRPARPKKRIGR
jgi:hypothetical protein